MGTVEDSDQSDASPSDILVESLTVSLGNPVADHPGHLPGHFPALVNDLLGAGGATGG